MQIANLQTAIAESTNPAMRASLQSKLKVFEHDRAAEFAAQTQAAEGTSDDAKVQDLQRRIAESTPDPKVTVAGQAVGNGQIVSGFAVQLPAGTLYAENTWRETADSSGTVRAITAGADGNHGAAVPDPEQGELVGWDLPSGTGRMKSLGFFQPPGPAHGSLHITGAAGDVLTLQAVDGTVYYFDVTNLKFVPAP